MSVTVTLPVKLGAEMPLTPADLEWSCMKNTHKWAERDVIWTNLATGQTLTVRQYAPEKVDNAITLEELRKSNVQVAYPHLFAVKLTPHLWVADL